METLIDVLSSNGLMPHGFCLRWNSPLLWLHVVSDVLITLAYYSIPLSLSYFVWQRKDLPYPRLFLLFGVFILACGTTHLMAVVVIWKPLYWLDGVVKVFTALVSVLAAVLMLRIIPEALQLPSSEQLHAEIEQRKQAEDALKQSESKFRALFDSSSDALLLSDREYFFDCNAASLAMFGCDDKAVFLSKRPDELSPEQQACGTNSKVLVQKYTDRVLLTGHERFEWLHKRMDTNEVFPAEVILTLILIHNKPVIYAVIRDISERKRAEERLKRSETQFRTLIESLPVGLTLHNTQTKILLHNPCALKLLDLNSEELLNSTSFDDNWTIFDEQGQLIPNYKFPVPQVIATRQTVSNVTLQVLRPKQQDRVWLLVTATPQLNPDGSVLQVICSFIDITELKQTEQRLSESETRLSLSQEYGGIGCWEADLINNRQVWSKTTYQLAGSPNLPNPRFEDFLALVHPDDKEIIIKAYQTHLMRGTKYDVEYRVLLNDGQIRWMRSIGRAEFDKDDRPIRFIGIVYDISERKAMEAELKRSNAELEQFAYAVSHDMRQPLRMITSYLGLIEKSLKDRLTTEQKQYLQFAIEGGKRMDNMILSLLDYSRVGQKHNSIKRISSRAALDEVLNFFKPELKTNNGSIIVNGQWVDLMVNMDELIRLLQNLIGNALKYHEENKPPHVTINAEVNAGLLKVSISDKGIGINPEQFNQLFKVFSRLQSHSRFEGTGVGLALCRKIVEHYGGKIGVESAGEKQGCTFWFELPIAVEKTA